MHITPAISIARSSFTHFHSRNNVQISETALCLQPYYNISIKRYAKLTEISKEATTGPISLYRWKPPATTPPPNDLFLNATAITGESGDPDNPIVGTTENATRETDEPLPTAVYTVWYKWIGAGTTQKHNFWTRRDFLIDVYTGSAIDALTLVGTSHDNGTSSVITFTRTVGTNYYIRVRPSMIVQNGPFTLGWNPQPDPPPAGPDVPVIEPPVMEQ